MRLQDVSAQCVMGNRSDVFKIRNFLLQRLSFSLGDVDAAEKREENPTYSWKKVCDYNFILYTAGKKTAIN